MSFRYGIRIQPSGRLVLSVFEGEVSIEAEREALAGLMNTPGVDLTADLLVDRRRASSTARREEFEARLEQARVAFSRLGGRPPRMAVLVAGDLEFGLARMFELESGDRMPHEVRVFRELDRACAWLGVEPGTLLWPEGMEADDARQA